MGIGTIRRNYKETMAYDSLSLEPLRKLLNQKGISFDDKAKKAELLKLLKEADA